MSSWSPYQAFYIEPMLYSTRAAGDTIVGVTEALDAGEASSGDVDHHVLLDAIQSIGNYSAKIFSDYFERQL